MLLLYYDESVKSAIYNVFIFYKYSSTVRLLSRIYIPTYALSFSQIESPVCQVYATSFGYGYFQANVGDIFNLQQYSSNTFLETENNVCFQVVRIK